MEVCRGWTGACQEGLQVLGMDWVSAGKELRHAGDGLVCAWRGWGVPGEAAGFLEWE